MERYESLGLVGEGSYGTVLKCRHRDSGRLVAIKKFVDSDDDKTVKKIALREIKLLRQLRHGNLVNLLEVWKRRRRWYLVFDFVERTLLDDLEHNPSGLDLNTSQQYLYQILSAAAFCHQQNIIHRDIKPENILVSQGGVVKLCDFGFARALASPAEGNVYTDYVATRWYRAPELLVGDIKYGKPVDVWAVGCLLVEMLTGQPLFPGDSDLDQIYHIVRCFGNLTAHHQELFYRNPVFSGVRLPECYGQVPLQQRFPAITSTALDLAQSCLQMDPERRAHCSELLEHPLFTQDSFHTRFLNELNAKMQKDHRENSTLPKITKAPRGEKGEGNEKNHRGRDNKQLEDMNHKVNKDKEKKDKAEKTKAKQPPKLSKTIRNTSEPLMTTKQSKTLGGKEIDNAARASVAMKSKPKATGAGSRKELPKSAKTLTSDSSKSTKTVTDRNENNTLVDKPKHGKVASPEPSENHSSSEDSLESTVDRTDFSLTLQACQPSSNDQIEVTTLTIPSVTKTCKISTASDHLTNQLTMETEQEGTYESSRVLPSNLEPSNTISNSCPEMTKTNTTLSINLPKTHASDLSSQSVAVFMEATAVHSTSTVPKGISNQELFKTDSTSIAKPTNDTGCETNKPSKDLPNQEDSFNIEDHEFLKISPENKTMGNRKSNISGRDHKEDPESSKISGVHQQSTSKSKIAPESRTPSAPILCEIPNTNSSVETPIPKTLKISDKENRKDLALSLSISATTKSLLNQTSKVPGSSSIRQKHKDTEVSSFELPHSKPVTGQSPAKSFNNHSTFTGTVTLKIRKTTFPTEARKKCDNPERKDSITSISTIADSTSVLSTPTPDHRALKRSFVLHNMANADFNEIVLHSPPPSSTTPIPSFSVVNDHLTLRTGFHPGNHSLRCLDKTRHHGGICSRLARQAVSSHVTASSTAKVTVYKCPTEAQQKMYSYKVVTLPSQVSDKSLSNQRSFLLDRGGVAMARKKSDVRFPDLSSSALPELRRRDGKHNVGIAKEQRKDKQPVPSISQSEHVSSDGRCAHTP
ncbi:cyclin-dependent kinase-like 5 isoform X3 [Scophthalmus maximus]|nr:cyclin-dependent kinase-like 5 isoform X3 [Scophthalmus maximus]